MPKKKREIIADRRYYAIASIGEEEAEITLYGDVVETVPKNFWTGEPIEGNFIVQSEFISDLNDVVASGVKKLTFRVNSFGGDAAVGLLIHNRLRELADSGVEITCRVDGVAMSAGSVIMCAANHIIVHPSSLVMIHKARSCFFGWYNADELRAEAAIEDGWDKAMLEIYSRRTGMSDTVLAHMMSGEVPITGREAVEKGFADELTEDGDVQIAASADRRALFVSGRRVALAFGSTAPEIIPTVDPKIEKSVSTASAEDIKNHNSPVDPGSTGGKQPMANNLEELRAENPTLAETVEREVRAAAAAENTTAVNDAVRAERERLERIDEIAPTLGNSQFVHEAKYGENPCTAEQLAFRAAQEAAKQGGTFMTNTQKDYAASGASGVSATPGTTEEGKTKTKAERRAEAKQLVASVLGKKTKED